MRETRGRFLMNFKRKSFGKLQEDWKKFDGKHSEGYKGG
jgi:hypothetical protein